MSKGAKTAKVTQKKTGARKTAARKTAGRKTAARKAASRQSTARKATARKATARKATARKATARKASTRKASTRKATTRKATAKSAPRKAAAKTTAKRGGRKTLDRFLEGQQKALVEERDVYTRQAETLRAEAEQLAQDWERGDATFTEDEGGEGDSINVERERDLALSAQALMAIEEIDRALAKIDNGTYGICESCGEKIPKERLKAVPQAALCVRCKTGGLGRR